MKPITIIYNYNTEDLIKEKYPEPYNNTNKY